MRRASWKRSWPCPRPPATCTAPNECASRVRRAAPDEATIERVPCSSPGHAEDLVIRLHGHRHAQGPAASATSTPSSRTPSTSRCTRVGEQLVGSGSVDMKGGDVLALGALRAFASAPRALRASSRCCSSATRSGGRPTSATSQRFAGFDACLCFEAGELTRRRRGRRRPAQGRGHDPRRPRTAAPRTPARRPTAAATRCSRWPRAAQAVAARHEPDGPAHLTAVPDRHALRRGVQRRPRRTASCSATCAPTTSTRSRTSSRHIPAEHNGVRLEAELIRRWPGMRPRTRTAPLLERASALLGRPIAPAARGGAERREPLRRPPSRHGRRPRPARRQGAQPRGVRARSVAADPRRGRARVIARCARGSLQAGRLRDHVVSRGCLGPHASVRASGTEPRASREAPRIAAEASRRASRARRCCDPRAHEACASSSIIVGFLAPPRIFRSGRAGTIQLPLSSRRDSFELARAQRARAARRRCGAARDGDDAALLEVHAGAGEVVDDLREGRARGRRRGSARRRRARPAARARRRG